MDEPLQIRVETVSGNVCLATPKRSATMRAVLAEVFGAVEGKPYCLLRGRQLALDLSLAAQGVQSLDTIHVVFVRPAATKKRELEGDAARRHEKALFEEALRVSDVAFLLFETSRRSNLLYSAFTDESDIEETEVEQTVVENSQRISDAPLPPCWLTPESDGHGQLVLKSCRPAKEPFVARELTREGDCL